MSNPIFYSNIDPDGNLIFPEELIAALGWEEGDELVIKMMENGQIWIGKKEHIEEDPIEKTEK